MDCADYRIDCDGDSDGNGNDLLYGVIDKKSVLELFQGALALLPFLAFGEAGCDNCVKRQASCYKIPHVLQQVGAKFRRLLGS